MIAARRGPELGHRRGPGGTGRPGGLRAPTGSPRRVAQVRVTAWWSRVPGADVVLGDLVRWRRVTWYPPTVLVPGPRPPGRRVGDDRESEPVDRDGEELPAGTVVTAAGCGTVTRTGPDSGLGQIAALIASAGVTVTPLQLRLRRLSRPAGRVAARRRGGGPGVQRGPRRRPDRDAHHRGQPGGRRRPGVPPGRGDGRAGARGPPDGQAFGGGAAAAGRGDARVRHRAGLGQDRHAHRGPDGPSAAWTPPGRGTRQRAGSRRLRGAVAGGEGGGGRRCGCCATRCCATTPWGCPTRTTRLGGCRRPAMEAALSRSRARAA